MKGNNEKYIFSTRFREERRKAGKTLGDVARHLEKSTSYISDIERGNRMPLREDDIRKFAELMGIEAEPLCVLAAESRGAFTLGTEGISPKARRVGAALMREWAELDDEKLSKIEALLEKD